MKSEAVKETIVHKQCIRQPAERPSPASGTKPSQESGKHLSHIRDGGKHCAPTTSRSVWNGGIGPINRRAPNHIRIVRRNINDLRAGRHNLNGGARTLPFRIHLKLRRASQLAALACLGAQILDGIHHVSLLRNECVPEIGHPLHVGIQPRQHVGKCHQRLHTGVPVLLLCRYHQLTPAQIAVILHPRARIHDFLRIGTRHKDLAQQRIRIKRNRHHEIAQLVTRERRVLLRGRILRLSGHLLIVWLLLRVRRLLILWVCALVLVLTWVLRRKHRTRRKRKRKHN